MICGIKFSLFLSIPIKHVYAHTCMNVYEGPTYIDMIQELLNIGL